MKLVLETADGVRLLADSQTGDAPIVGVLPGDDIALHRLHLPGTSPAERLEEARMRATDLAAQPIEDLHIAIGEADAGGASWVALMDRARMADHITHFHTHGAEAAHMVPAALLLDGADMVAASSRLGDRLLFRTPELAGLIEADLTPAVTGGVPDAKLAQLAEFAPASPAALPLDLLQGEFALRRKWWKERGFRFSFALLGVLLLAALAMPSLVRRSRDAAAIAGYDAAVVRLGSHLPGTPPVDAAQAAAMLAKARKAAEGAAIGARLSFVTAQVEAVPGARLQRVELAADGRLQLALGGPADAVNRLSAALMAGPFNASGGGLALALGDRRAAGAAGQSPLAASMLRFAGAREDAAILALRKATGPLSADAALAALHAAGLADSQIEAGKGAPQILVPAARSTTLLPLLAELERKGARFTSMVIVPNQDETVNARLEPGA